MGMARRSGFTLIELLIGMVMTSIVLGATIGAIVRQQRFYRGTAAIVETRSQIRQATMMMTADLRGISPKGSDLIEISDDALVFRGTIGSSVLCVLNGNTITVPPATLASGNVLTSWSMTPGVGDVVLIFDDLGTTGGVDDVWRPYTITAPVSEVAGGCPASTLLTTAADASSNSYRFTLSAPPPPTTLNRPMRFTRTMMYKLFQAADDQWYLGFCSPDCDANGWEPVAGPFLQYAANNPGVALAYLNEDGATTATPSNVARVGVAVRGKTRMPINIEGMRNGHVADSLHVTVGLRNRR